MLLHTQQRFSRRKNTESQRAFLLPASEEFFAKRRSKFITLALTRNIEQASRIFFCRLQRFVERSGALGTSVHAYRPKILDEEQKCTLASASTNTVNECSGGFLVGLLRTLKFKPAFSFFWRVRFFLLPFHRDDVPDSSQTEIVLQ